MDLFHTLMLGILQGITEFLPISSSAHLILTPVLTGWPDQGIAFDLAVHVGTLLAVVIYFRRDVFELTRDGITSALQRRYIGQGKLAMCLFIGTLPAAIAGLFLLNLVDSQLRSIEIIFFTTLIFGLLLGWSDWRPNKQRQLTKEHRRDIASVRLRYEPIARTATFIGLIGSGRGARDHGVGDRPQAVEVGPRIEPASQP